MAKIVLGKKKNVQTLDVEFGDKTYKVPLADSLTMGELRALKDGDDDGFAFFGRYLSDEVVSALTLEDFKELNAMWKKASQEASGIDLGE